MSSLLVWYVRKIASIKEPKKAYKMYTSLSSRSESYSKHVGYHVNGVIVSEKPPSLAPIISYDITSFRIYADDYPKLTIQLLEDSCQEDNLFLQWEREEATAKSHAYELDCVISTEFRNYIRHNGHLCDVERDSDTLYNVSIPLFWKQAYVVSPDGRVSTTPLVDWQTINFNSLLEQGITCIKITNEEDNNNNTVVWPEILVNTSQREQQLTMYRSRYLEEVAEEKRMAEKQQLREKRKRDKRIE